MCCFVTLFLVLISRIGIVYWWLTNPQSHDLPFKTWVLPNVPVIAGWLWTLVGAIFLPWTTLAYLFLFPGGIVGFEWIVLGVAFLIDLGSHGGTYYYRSRIRNRS